MNVYHWTIRIHLVDLFGNIFIIVPPFCTDLYCDSIEVRFTDEQQGVTSVNRISIEILHMPYYTIMNRRESIAE